MIAMQNVQETNLAWALVEAAKPQLSADERSGVFVIIGAGDTFAAIRILLKLVVVKQIPLRADLLQRCSNWLDPYAHHQEEQELRRLIARLWNGYATPVSTTVGVSDLPATPTRVEHRLWDHKLNSHAMAAC
jgi:hypothetical protein